MKPPVLTARNVIPHRFKPGQSGNPKGRPRGGRNRLSEDFLTALADDFALHGRQAIVEMRQRDPATYCRIIASLMPKDVEKGRPLEDMTDDELIAAIAILQTSIAASAIDGEARRIGVDGAANGG